eukprot:11828591-Alexandrium_andersonii.AAC.1
MHRTGLRRPLAKLLPTLRRDPPRRVAAPANCRERARPPLLPSLFLPPRLRLQCLPAVTVVATAAAE